MNEEKLLKLKSYISIKYDLEILDITPVKNVVRIETKDGYKCLKRSKFGEGHFLFILSAMKHLQNNGFDGIIPFIPANNGDTYIELEDGYGYMTDWVDSRECDYSNPVELKMAAVTLSRLHKSSQSFAVPKHAQPRIGWGKWVEKFSRRLQEMKAFREIIEGKDTLSYFDNVYMENFDYFYNQGITSIEHLKNSRYFELSLKESEVNSFCHHDYAHHNVLITDDFKVYIIDFDYCILDSRLHDVSSLILRNVRHGNWSMEKAQYIIDCYLREGNIEKDEIPVMHGFMEFPQDFWQVGLQYYVEKQNWQEDNFNKRLNNAVKDKFDREQFLDEFRSEIEL